MIVAFSFGPGNIARIIKTFNNVTSYCKNPPAY
jgi:hypothetical protein